jgi:hypothetical protein
MFTVPEFCAWARISVPHYYKLRAQSTDNVPVEARIGAKVFITQEAAETWRLSLSRPKAAPCD